MIYDTLFFKCKGLIAHPGTIQVEPVTIKSVY